MTTEQTPAGVAIAVFDHRGTRIVQPVPLPHIVEPDDVIGTAGGQPAGKRIEAIAASIGEAPAIGVRFGKFTDGRAYSLAARLREAGYRGELHAIGEINQEVVFLLKRVGFTHFHIPDPGHDQLPDTILTPFGGHYQAGSDGSLAPWQAPVAA